MVAMVTSYFIIGYILTIIGKLHKKYEGYVTNFVHLHSRGGILNRHWNTYCIVYVDVKTIADTDLKALHILNIVLCTIA